MVILPRLLSSMHYQGFFHHLVGENNLMQRARSKLIENLVATSTLLLVFKSLLIVATHQLLRQKTEFDEIFEYFFE